MLCEENIGNIGEFSHLLSQSGVDPNVHDQVRHELAAKHMYMTRVLNCTLLCTGW